MHRRRAPRLLETAAAVAVAAIAACSAPGPTVTPGPASTMDEAGSLRLELLLPKTTFGASEVITGQATLSLADGDETEIAGSGSGVITFSYAEIGGTRSMGGASTDDCAPYTIGPAAPISTELTHGAGWSQDDPNAAFYEAFARADDIHLPPGAWRITARAEFLGAGCTKPVMTLETDTVVVVTP